MQRKDGQQKSAHGRCGERARRLQEWLRLAQSHRTALQHALAVAPMRWRKQRLLRVGGAFTILGQSEYGNLGCRRTVRRTIAGLPLVGDATPWCVRRLPVPRHVVGFGDHAAIATRSDG